MNGISTISNINSLISQSDRLQTNYSTLEIQSSSGLISPTYEGIAADSQQLISLESLYSRTTSQVAATKSAQNIANLAYGTLTNASNLITNVIGTLSSALSANNAATNSGSTQTIVSQSLSELSSLLNTKYGSQYIFGGSVTNKAPVDVTAVGYGPFSSPTIANTSYYQGDNKIKSVQVSDNLTVNYSITANAAPFEQALRAMSLVASNPSDPIALQEGFDLLKSASNGVSNLQGEASTTASTLENQTNIQSGTLNRLDSIISDLRNVDIASVATKMSQTQTQLQASYTTLGRLLKLRLTDYLK